MAARDQALPLLDGEDVLWERWQEFIFPIRKKKAYVGENSLPAVFSVQKGIAAYVAHYVVTNRRIGVQDYDQFRGADIMYFVDLEQVHVNAIVFDLPPRETTTVAFSRDRKSPPKDFTFKDLPYPEYLSLKSVLIRVLKISEEDWHQIEKRAGQMVKISLIFIPIIVSVASFGYLASIARSQSLYSATAFWGNITALASFGIISIVILFRFLISEGLGNPHVRKCYAYPFIIVMIAFVTVFAYILSLSPP
ncbi:MAG TPA: hypothetical protein VKK79_12805 [Candidatus Lokiarchaeia archaeon]|nr:hypothetical protein [Candidatus Lokiarchaeia archaeon]